MARNLHDNGTKSEGVEQATSSCGETMANDKADDLRMANATSREDKCFGTRVVLETSSDEGANMRKECVIKADKECEADMIEEIAMENEIREPWTSRRRMTVLRLSQHLI